MTAELVQFPIRDNLSNLVATRVQVCEESFEDYAARNNEMAACLGALVYSLKLMVEMGKLPAEFMERAVIQRSLKCLER